MNDHAHAHAHEFRVKLVARNLDLYYAWKSEFDAVSRVEVIDNDILREQADAIVSPANSFGYMDGGLDLKYSEHFGWQLEDRLRAELEAHHFGEIPVGQAVIIETGRDDVPYLISAPTMRVPSNVSDTVNAYLAFKAILQAVMQFNKANSESRIKTLLCPGLGTGEGRMPTKMCAAQMKAAWDVCTAGRIVKHGGLAGAVDQHLRLLGRDSARR